MLLPAAGVNGLDAILNTIDAQFICTHAHNCAVLQMGCVRDSVVAFHVTLVSNPYVAKDGNGPMRRWDAAQRMEKNRTQYEPV